MYVYIHAYTHTHTHTHTHTQSLAGKESTHTHTHTHSLAGKESICNVGDLDLIPGLGRSPGKGKSYPFQYSEPEKSMG